MGGIRNDRYGNPNILKMAKSVVSKKTGEVMPIYKTYLEVGSIMFKVEISECKKETKDGHPGMWVKFTKMPKRQQGSGFGNNSQGYQQSSKF
jgi:hypothetical protein